jgi:hypothetical protein
MKIKEFIIRKLGGVTQDDLALILSLQRAKYKVINKAYLDAKRFKEKNDR